MDRNGLVGNDETIGRFAGNLLLCPSCNKPMEILVNIRFNKKEK